MPRGYKSKTDRKYFPRYKAGEKPTNLVRLAVWVEPGLREKVRRSAESMRIPMEQWVESACLSQLEQSQKAS
jgi:hypothetical protein